MQDRVDPSGDPRLSVIIPANDEAEHIGPCLDAVLASQKTGPVPVEVIVAANGCTDDTVARARAYTPRFAERGWRFRVLDIAQGGKVGALNHADTAAQAAARAYLDADVLVDADLLAQVLAALDLAKPVYVTGRMRVTRAKSWVSRRYGALWLRLPFMEPGSAPGAGFFAVNGAGRTRWKTFPDIISDDTFVRWLFAPDERIEVSAGYAWPLVEGFGALTRVRRRQDAGVFELRQLYPQLEANEGKPSLAPRDQLRLMGKGPVDYTVYMAVKLATRFTRGRRSSDWARGRR